MNRHHFASGVCAAALVAIIGVAAGCGRWPSPFPPEPNWGNERIIGAIATLRAEDARVATVDLDRCPRQPAPLKPETVRLLLQRLAGLKAAPTIGMRSQWERWRLITLDFGEKGHLEIFVGTRESLYGAPIVGIDEGTTTIRGGFYDGKLLWQWLQCVPEVAALEAPSTASRPCQ